MTGDANASRQPGLPRRAVRHRPGRRAGSGLGAVAFRYLIYFFTWLATGRAPFGQDGHVGSSHLPWLGLAFFVVIPAAGGLLYEPWIAGGCARHGRARGRPGRGALATAAAGSS